jgi:hypothetical protein
MEFKLQQHLKINWLKNASDKGGAMQMVIDSCTPGNKIVNIDHSRFGRMWSDIEPDTLLKLCTKNNNIYEVITSFPHKVYFDIDKASEPDVNFLPLIKNAILELFPNAQLSISGSITDAKTSYHIILNNYLISSENDRQHIKGIVRYLNENVSDAFDTKVYTKNRNMKCPNQS